MLFLPVGNVINCDKVLKTVANLIKKTAKRIIHFLPLTKKRETKRKNTRKNSVYYSSSL